MAYVYHIVFVYFLMELATAQLFESFVDRHEIQSPQITNWGEWGQIETCPPGYFVTGMQLKIESGEGWKDDTGLNGIRLFCSRLGSAVDIYEETPLAITSSVGPFGEWKSVFRCGDNGLDPKTTAVVGFQMKVEPPKGVHDDTSANNFRIFCATLAGKNTMLGDGTEQAEPQELVLEGDGTKWGEWSTSQLCHRGFAICGIMTQVDHGGHAKGYDDTALNNVRAECCKVKFHDSYLPESSDYNFNPDIRDHSDIQFPDPIESAKELERTLLAMSNVRNNETASPNKDTLSPEMPAEEPTTPQIEQPTEPSSTLKINEEVEVHQERSAIIEETEDNTSQKLTIDSEAVERSNKMPKYPDEDQTIATTTTKQTPSTITTTTPKAEEKFNSNSNELLVASSSNAKFKEVTILALILFANYILT